MCLPLSLGRRLASTALAATVLASCADPEPTIEHRYGPYEGEAYPDRRPTIAIPPGGMGVVSDSRSDTLSLLELATGERIGVYPVGRDPVTIDGPHHVAVDVPGRAVYVALSYPVLAGATGPHASHGGSSIPGYVQKLSLDDMRILGQARVDTNPGDIVLSEDGKRLVVSHFDLKRAVDNAGDLAASRSELAVIDPSTLALAGSPDPVRIPLCIAAHGVALSRPDAARAYVACYGEDALAIVDLTEPNAAPKLVPVGPGAAIGSPSYGPYAAVMSPDQKTIAVSNTESKDVRFFDVASETFDEARTISLRGAPYFVAWTPDGERLYVPTQAPDALRLFDVAQGNAELATRDLSGACDKPHVVDLAGDALFVVCEGDQTKTPGNVLKLDPATLETVASTAVGLYPDAFVRVPGGAP
jgi:DNA-binding beta-propeller fold protein YncE